ncbi:MAG: hypothetical protein ACLFUF_03725 [Opitutales bacterium]
MRPSPAIFILPALLLQSFGAATALAQPALPEGLQEEEKTDAPTSEASDEKGAPALPSGLRDSASPKEAERPDAKKPSPGSALWRNTSGYLETRIGSRLRNDANQRRLSFYDPAAGRVVGKNAGSSPIRPDDTFKDDEWALRAYRTIESWEVAAYGYSGFWKSPQGFDPASGRATFPRLRVFGASLRGPLQDGILSSEVAWYDSLDDRNGDDPFVPNSQFRFLIGYEEEIHSNLTLGVQYYLERLLDYGALTRNQPEGFPEPDQNRHLFTTRLTWLTHSQNVTWTLFAFASPSDEDFYLRGLWSWDATDQLTLEAGFNWFEGREQHTFFGQLETNSNAFTAVRYNF